MPRYQRKVKFLFLLLIFVIIVGAIFLQENDAELAVHQTVLKGLSDKLQIEKFSFYSHPSTCRGVKHSSNPAVSKVVFDNFYQNNNVISSKPRQLLLHGNQYHIISKENSHLIYVGKPPKLSGMPKQLINLSRAGFNTTKTQALVCVESEESSDLVYLTKDGENWEIQKWSYIW